MRRISALAAALVAAGIAAGGANAADRLNYDGAALPAVAIEPGGALEARVDVAGDEVLSAHALLRPASSNEVWMRDRDGFWTAWDGDRDNLIPAAARREGNELVIKIFTSPPPGVGSMTVTVAYRTPEGLKYGWFDAAERAE